MGKIKSFEKRIRRMGGGIMENLFSRLKDEKLKSMNLMQHELCE